MGEGVPQGVLAGDPLRIAQRIGLGVTAVVTALMAWDHLWGNQPGPKEPFPVDAATFLVAMLLSLACAALTFLVLIPRTRLDAVKTPRRALWLSGLAVPLTLVAGWLGFPLIMAGAGITLGILAPGTPARSRTAIAAIGLGVLVLAFGVLATAYPGTEQD